MKLDMQGTVGREVVQECRQTGKDRDSVGRDKNENEREQGERCREGIFLLNIHYYSVIGHHLPQATINVQLSPW